MRALGLLGLLLAAAIVLILMVKVGQSASSVDGGGGSKAQTGSQKAYQEMKKDGDLDDPKEEMRDALKGGG